MASFPAKIQTVFRTVKEIQVINSSGYHRLDEAAIAAVRTWRCNPPLQNGQPVRAIALQPFSFVLQE